MRRAFVGVLAIALAVACSTASSASTTFLPSQGNMGSAPVDISCQPYGYAPVRISFSFPPGPVSASIAEQTAVELYRACLRGAVTIADLTSTVHADLGSRNGPNAGQSVWLVEISAQIVPASFSDGYHEYFVIEVNQATGVPTVIAYG